jgi:hypothetical protein
MIALAAAAVVWTGCEHRPRVRPASAIIACGDANLYATKLRWTSWGPAGAVATGIGHQNDCTPNCAAGHFATFPITIRLSRAVTCKGRREFARIRWRGVTIHGDESFDCAFLTLP